MIASAETKPYIDAFSRTKRAGEPSWIRGWRETALRSFGEKGFPTRRQEEWRFTDLRPLQRVAFLPSFGGKASLALAAANQLSTPSYRLVVVNGRFAPELSALDGLPSGVRFASMADALGDQREIANIGIADVEIDVEAAQPFEALNSAFFADGFILELQPDTVVERPIEVIHIGESDAPRSFHTRNRLLLRARSRARVVETYVGHGGYWTNAVTTARLAEGAKLFHAKVQSEALDAIHFAVIRAHLAQGAAYDNFSLTLGARLSRQDVFATFEGEGAALRLDGAYLLRGEQEATTATFVDHAAPGGKTRETFKGVVEDRAHGVFLGKIAVRPGADKTDAHQVNRNLLLSPRAAVDTKPELEILADDVKCSHGATVGDLDEAALFYLRSRGLTNDEARRLLIEAFAAETIEDAVDAGPLRAYLRLHLDNWLKRRGSL
jgi:Fe-S cluster assembly protein SufD